MNHLAVSILALSQVWQTYVDSLISFNVPCSNMLFMSNYSQNLMTCLSIRFPNFMWFSLWNAFNFCSYALLQSVASPTPHWREKSPLCWMNCNRFFFLTQCSVYFSWKNMKVVQGNFSYCFPDSQENGVINCN